MENIRQSFKCMKCELETFSSKQKICIGRPASLFILRANWEAGRGLLTKTRSTRSERKLDKLQCMQGNTRELSLTQFYFSTIADWVCMYNVAQRDHAYKKLNNIFLNWLNYGKDLYINPKRFSSFSQFLEWEPNNWEGKLSDTTEKTFDFANCSSTISKLECF